MKGSMLFLVLLLFPGGAWGYDFSPDEIIEPELAEAMGAGAQEVLILTSEPLGNMMLDLSTHAMNTQTLLEYEGLGIYSARVNSEHDLTLISEIPAVTSITRPRAAKLADFIIEADSDAPVDYKNRGTKARHAREDYSVDGYGSVVCVIDNGIDNDHQGLQRRVVEDIDNVTSFEYNESLVLKEKDFSSDKDNRPGDHGTHVAGIIAHQPMEISGKNISGIAPGISGFLDAKGLSVEGSGSEAGIIKAMKWCADEFRELRDEEPEKHRHLIYSMSLGMTLGPYNGPIVQAVEVMAEEENAVFVIAMGNEMVPDSPGVASNAITVGAADEKKDVAFFSGNGPAFAPDPYKPDVSAPGVEVYSSIPGNRYEYMSGTSMATPVVSGVVALSWENYPRESWGQIKERVLFTSEDTGEEINREGYGHVHALNAVGTPEPDTSFMWKLRKSGWWIEAKLAMMAWF
jgi:subtilisin family serine protease